MSSGPVKQTGEQKNIYEVCINGRSLFYLEAATARYCKKEGNLECLGMTGTIRGESKEAHSDKN